METSPCAMDMHCLGPMNPEGMAQNCAGSQSRPTGWKMMFAWLDCLCIHPEENSCLQLYENPSSWFDICSHLKLSFSNEGNRYFTWFLTSLTQGHKCISGSTGYKRKGIFQLWHLLFSWPHRIGGSQSSWNQQVPPGIPASLSFSTETPNLQKFTLQAR